MKVIIHETGKMIGLELEYGFPEGSAEFVMWILNRPPPGRRHRATVRVERASSSHSPYQGPRPARHRPLTAVPSSLPPGKLEVKRFCCNAWVQCQVMFIV